MKSRPEETDVASGPFHDIEAYKQDPMRFSKMLQFLTP